MGFDQLRSDDVSPLAVDVAPGDLAMLIYTGGTTGPSKGCMISGNQMCHIARLLLRFNHFGFGEPRLILRGFQLALSLPNSGFQFLNLALGGAHLVLRL